MQCQVTVVSDQLTVFLAGTLTYADTAAFSEVFQQISSARTEQCTIDLGGLEHTDSSGLRMLLQVCDLCRDTGVYLTFRQAAGQVRERLLHCRFDIIVTIEGYSKLPRHHKSPAVPAPVSRNLQKRHAPRKNEHRLSVN